MSGYTIRIGPYMVQCGTDQLYASSHESAEQLARRELAKGAREATIWLNVQQLRSTVRTDIDVTFDVRHKPTNGETT
jgi:hypothetical protein